MPATRANRGSSLEAIVIDSQCGVIAVTKMMAGVKWLPGGRTVRQKGVVDFVGTVCQSGRSICFDAKQCGLKGRWDVGNRDHLASHQRDYLIRQGQAGAISGIVVEATHASLAAFYWFEWRWLVACGPSLPWDDARLVPLGPNSRAIDFRRVPGVLANVAA